MEAPRSAPQQPADQATEQAQDQAAPAASFVMVSTDDAAGVCSVDGVCS